MTRIILHRISTGHSSFLAPASPNPTGFGLQRRSPPFLTPPSPRTADELPCEAGCSPSQRLHAVLTSGHRVDAVEPICSASKAQRPNPMKVEVAFIRWWSPCELHQAETGLCISLPFSITFIANIARKRPKLNRGKTTDAPITKQSATIS